MPEGSQMPGWPRAMREDLAAQYVSLGVTAFRKAMADGKVNPIWLTGGRKAWLKEDLDRWLDQRAGRMPAFEEPNPWH